MIAPQSEADFYGIREKNLFQGHGGKFSRFYPSKEKTIKLKRKIFKLLKIIKIFSELPGIFYECTYKTKSQKLDKQIIKELFNYLCNIKKRRMKNFAIA